MNRLLILVVCLFCLSSFTSCHWLGRMCGCGGNKVGTGVLVVQVSPWFGDRIPVYALAFAQQNGKRGALLATQRAMPDGAVSFIVPMGERCNVLAYADSNRNGRKDSDEPSASVSDLEPLSPYGTGPQYAPVQVLLPGKGVPRKTTQPKPRLSPADRAKLEGMLSHLPDGVRL